MAESKKKKGNPASIRIDPDRIAKLAQAITVGAPMKVALRYAGIGERTYDYWKATAVRVKAVAEHLDLMDQMPEGEDRRKEEDAFEARCDELGFTPDLVREIQKNRAYAAQVVDAVDQAEDAKAQCILFHLTKIRKADKTNSWNASAWYLERTMPAEFGRKDPDVAKEKQQVDKITVQYVDPKIDQDRVKAMEAEVLEEINGKEAKE